MGRPTLVVHAGRVDGSDGTRVGFVVSKQVGNAVVRNRVKRRLRHLAADQLPSTPPGLDLVVRALPAAATSPARTVDGPEVGVGQGVGQARGVDAVKYLVIGLLKAYRLVISPLYGNVCRYYPSCSAYALRAVQVHGAVKGSWLAGRRLLRCHPWTPGWVRSRTGNPGV